MAHDIERLYFESTPPIDVADLGRGARLLVPHGAAFGTPQLIRRGTFHDWVRKKPDAYWVPGDRTSAHAGADLAFFVRRGQVYKIPEGLPVRAVLGGVVAWVGRRSDPESTHGVVLRHGGSRSFVYTHYADVGQIVKPGQRVTRGQIVGHARPYSSEYPVVVVHFAMGVYVPRWGSDGMDPTFLLRRWGVRHPVGSQLCAADELNVGTSGLWRSPGVIEGLSPVAKWDRRWKDEWR